ARTGLGVTLAPEIVAVIDARQETLLLRLGAKAQQHRGAHRDAERNDRRRAGVAELLFEDVALHDVPAGAAPLLRPRGRHPALLGEQPVPAEKFLAREVRIVLDFLAQ